MKKIKWVIILVVVIALSFVYSYIDKRDYIYSTDVDSSEYINTGVLYEDIIEQEFVCKEDVVDSLSLKMSTSGDVSDVLVKYELFVDGSLVRNGALEVEAIENNKFNTIDFKKVKNVKNSKFELRIMQIGGNQYNGVSFYLSPEREGETKLVVRGEETKGTLTLRLITHRFDLETFIVSLLLVSFVIAFFIALVKLFK